MNTRVKQLRLLKKLSQREFGEQIGLKQTSVADIETGRSNLTDRNISLICKKFQVNEYWLRTGKGNIFSNTQKTILKQLKEEYNLNSFKLAMIEQFLNLSPDQQDSIMEYVRSLIPYIEQDEEATQKNSKEEQFEIKLVARGSATLVGTRAEIIKALEEDLDRDDNDDYDAY